MGDWSLKQLQHSVDMNLPNSSIVCHPFIQYKENHTEVLGVSPRKPPHIPMGG